MTSTLEYIKQILDHEMSLPTGRCFAYNSEVDLPKDSDLFVVLYFSQRTPYANNIKYNYTDDNVTAIQSYNVVEDIQIACISRNNDARDRVHEVYMALNSYYAQDVQTKYKFHLSTTGGVFDNSFLESTARLNRFDVRIKVIRTYDKNTSVDYYDNFEFNVWENADSGQVIKENFNIV